jgi:hypothetical protein
MQRLQDAMALAAGKAMMAHGVKPLGGEHEYFEKVIWAG